MKVLIYYFFKIEISLIQKENFIQESDIIFLKFHQIIKYFLIN